VSLTSHDICSQKKLDAHSQRKLGHNNQTGLRQSLKHIFAAGEEQARASKQPDGEHSRQLERTVEELMIREEARDLREAALDRRVHSHTQTRTHMH